MCAAKLSRRYHAELYPIPVVRALLHGLPTDPRDVTLDYGRYTLQNLVREHSQTDRFGARFLIGRFLHEVYFTPEDEIPLEWWYEMDMVLQKLLGFIMVLESEATNNSWRDPETIPQIYLKLYLRLKEKRKGFAALRSAFEAQVETILLTRQGEDYAFITCFSGE